MTALRHQRSSSTRRFCGGVLVFLGLSGAAASFTNLALADEAAVASDGGSEVGAGSRGEPSRHAEGIAGKLDVPDAGLTAPDWMVAVDTLFLHRSHAEGYGVLYNRNNGRELFSASSLGDDTQAGVRVTLLRRVSDCYWLDIEYFGIDGWSDRASFDGGNYLLIGDRSRSGPPVETASILYASRLHTAEINLRGNAQGWLQPLAGFRWVRLGETYRAEGLWDIGNGLNGYTLDYGTHNDLYGLQIGAAALVWDRGPLSISALGKAGIFLGDLRSRGSFEANDLGEFSASTRTQRASFFSEIGVNATCRITKHVALRGGYQVYWLEGVSLAPNQVLSTDLVNQTGGIDKSGGLFLHGADVGLQVTW